MQALILQGYGDMGRVALTDVDPPVIGDHEMLVAVHAASVNPVDYKTRDGNLRRVLPYRLPITLGSDLSGVVTAVGARVTRFQPGDAVFARLDKLRIGAFAEYAAVSESAAALKPATLTHVEAAAVPLVALTTYQAFEGRVGQGTKVLIHAGSGGVGTFAIQMAKLRGATVATTTSGRNAAFVRGLGADVVIDYTREHFDDVLRDYDVVYDTLGGEALMRSFTVLKPGGVVVSVAGPPDEAFARQWGLSWLLRLGVRWLSRGVQAQARRHQVRYAHLFMAPDGQQLARIGEWLEAGKIRPVIDRVFPLSEVKDALAYVEAGRTRGKVVIQVR